MSARLTMTVSGNIRWANVRSSAFIPKAIDRIIPMAEQLNRDITPRGQTGKLQDSFRSERSERSVRFYWDASYAKYVDKGTQESSGRYVPAIGKRLISTVLSPRQQVSRQARKEGFSARAARAAMVTPIVREKEPAPMAPGIAAGAFYARRSTTTKVSGEKTLAAGGPGRVTGEISIKTGLSTYRRQQAERHELYHAVQWAGGRSFLETENKPLEFEAMVGTARAAGQKRNIGTHPGIKGAFFSRHISNLLKVYLVEHTLDAVKEAFR